MGMQLKYLQQNVWLGGKIFDPLLSFLKKENADIVALQEVYDGHDPHAEKRFRTLDILKKELRYPYHAFAPSMIDTLENRNIPWGNAVLSKFPIAASEAIFFDVPFGLGKTTLETAEMQPRNMLHATLRTPAGELHVFSIHGIWGTDGEDNPRRLAMSKTILKHVKNKPNVILSGDFNVREKTKTIALLEKNLTSVFKNEFVTTFNLRHKTDPKFARAVIDFLFVSPDVTVTSHHTPPVDVSDHIPLLATLEI